MSDKLPFMKFYPKDWRNDIELRSCSLAARGLWLEMIAIMHQAEPYGHLLIAGKQVTEAQLAGNVGASTEEVGALLIELQAAGVFSRTRTGVIYSRKMTRDEKARRNARENGKKGGNPTLCKPKDNPPPDNPRDKDTLKPQRFRGSDIREDLPPPPESLTSAREPDSAPQAERPEARPVASPGGGDGGATPCSEGEQKLGDELADLFNGRTAAWAVAGIHVHRWREAGANDVLIRAVAQAVKRSCDASGREPPSHPRYLDQPIQRAIEDVRRPMPAAEPQARRAPVDETDALIAQARRYRSTT